MSNPMAEIRRINRLPDVQLLIREDNLIVNGGIYTCIESYRDRESLELSKKMGKLSEELFVNVKTLKLDGRGGIIAERDMRMFYKGEEK